MWEDMRHYGSRPNLPRSRHLPRASTDGSWTRKANKTGGAAVDRSAADGPMRYRADANSIAVR